MPKQEVQKCSCIHDCPDAPLLTGSLLQPVLGVIVVLSHSSIIPSSLLGIQAKYGYNTRTWRIAMGEVGQSDLSAHLLGYLHNSCF